MFFGGLFTAYLVYRTMYPAAFAAASSTLNVPLGALNTAVLICSSLTMALSIYAAQINRRKLIVVFLLATIVLGAVFLGVKTVEYMDKFEHHLVPGPHYAPTDPHLQGMAGQQSQLFFSLYFIMTGLHALHMIIGIGVLSVLAVQSWKGRYDSSYYNPLECTGLYWHFVDIVWIFLFPLLYLLGAHAR
jgi:cytochrome c oxidase subunit 3